MHPAPDLDPIAFDPVPTASTRHDGWTPDIARAWVFGPAQADRYPHAEFDTSPWRQGFRNFFATSNEADIAPHGWQRQCEASVKLV